jgi:prevent-host-death family protein
MVMKQIPSHGAQRRVGVAEAKAHLSNLLRELAAGPVIVHNRGRDLAVLVGIDEYERLARDADQKSKGAQLLLRVAELKLRYGGGVDDFEPPQAKLRTRYPFRAR